MPSSIKWAERIMYLCLGLELLGLVLDWSVFSRYYHKYPTFYPVVIVIAFAVQIFWINLVTRRASNTARWLTFVVVVASTINSVFAFSASYKVTPHVESLRVVAAVLWIVAIGLLFTPDARPWYRRNEAS